MKRVISLCTMVAVLLLAGLLWKELIVDTDATKFGIASTMATLGLLSVAVAGLVSLRLLRAHRKLVEGIWLLLLSILGAYLTVDVIAGQILLGRLSPPMMQDDFVHHKLIPGTRSQFRTRDFRYVQRVNKFGLRGEDVSAGKEPGTYRILMLGDSFTMGKGVRDDETFSALLEKSLSTPGRRVEVMNAGVDSYAPILSYRQLVTGLGDLLQPDLVVLNFDMSDLVQETAYRNVSVRDSTGEIVAFRLRNRTGGDAIKDIIQRNLYLTSMAWYHWSRWRARNTDSITVENLVTLANPLLLRHTLADDDTDRTKQWQNVFDSVLKIRRYCDDNGIRFMLTTYPWGHQVSKDEWTPGRSLFFEQEVTVSDRSILTLETFARSNSIVFANMFPAFRAYHGASPLYFDFDMHWTTAGHQVIAAELRRHIVEKFLPGKDRTYHSEGRSSSATGVGIVEQRD